VQAIADYLASLTPPPPPTDGATLYANNCAGCHGAGAATTKGGADVSRINTGISSVASMNYLSGVLSAANIQAIADYLAQFTPVVTGPLDVPHTQSEGGVMHAVGNNYPYTNGCSSCHGAQLQGASGPSCTSCHGTEWSQNPPSTNDGPTLYKMYCEGCHGVDSESSKVGATLTRINTGITAEPLMSSLSVLTTTQRQAIADYLVSLGPTPPPPPTTDGAGLYSSYCAGCHGVGAATTKGGATVTRINSGISSVASMNYLSTALSAADVQAIADYLAQFSGTGGTTTIPHTKSEEGVMHAPGNNYPYTNGCTTCHGASLQGGVGPSCTSCHGVEWSESAPEGGGPTVPHTVNEEGVYHAEGNNTPYSSGCTACHGTSLQGAIGPSCTSCHGVQWTETAPPVTSTDGTALYATYCSACHGAGNASTKIGATVTRINNGISTVASMNSLSTLSTAQRQAISDYLVSLQSTTPPPTSSAGETLYAQSCAGCHGAGTSSTKAGASVVRIVNAITGTTSVASMTSLSNMTVANVQAISDYLVSLQGGTPPVVDGASLYASYCASCHGAGESSTKIGATVTRINSGISSVTSMNSLSSLTAAEVQVIADYLISLVPTTPPSGEQLYATNCSGCHGTGAATTKGGADATRINNGINNVASMNYLSGVLTSADIQSVATYLAQFTPVVTGPIDVPHTDSQSGAMHATGKNYPYTNGCSSCHGARLQGAYGPSCTSCHGTEWSQSPPSTTNGPTLYAMYCEGCHGVDSESSKVGASITRINNGISNEPLMSSLSVLTTSQKQAIADYLASLAPTTTGGTAGTGETLYANNCGGCHGVGAATTKGGATVSRINTGISSVSSMNYLSGVLSANDIQAIADYLAQFSSTGGTTTTVPHYVNEGGVYHAAGNKYPYSNGCTTCHGASLQGGIGPSCYSCHGQEWNGSGSGSYYGGGD
jgi:mono/diheme cytochrome c family protein